MPKVYVNNLGFLAGPTVKDATREIEVSDEINEKISSWPADKIWQYDFETKEFNLVITPILDGLRFARQMMCFNLINRGPAWYNSLSDEKRAEVDKWYKGWLDVTETTEPPEKPDWLD